MRPVLALITPLLEDMQTIRNFEEHFAAVFHVKRITLVPLLPVIISRLLSSSWEETTSPMVKGDQIRRVSELVTSCTPGENTRDVSRSLKFPSRSASLSPVRGARLRLCRFLYRRSRRGLRRGNNSQPGRRRRRRWTQVWFTQCFDTPSRNHHWSNVFSRPCQGCGHNHGHKWRNLFDRVFIESVSVSFCRPSLFGVEFTTYEDDCVWKIRVLNHSCLLLKNTFYLCIKLLLMVQIISVVFGAQLREGVKSFSTMPGVSPEKEYRQTLPPGGKFLCHLLGRPILYISETSHTLHHREPATQLSH